MSVTVSEIRTSSLLITPLRLAVAPPALGGDHGELTGLEDDDHPQYLTQARGDARYSALAHAHLASELLPLEISTASAAQVSLFDPTAGDAAAGKFSSCASSHSWSNGPAGNPNYVDHVASWGWNIKAPTVQDIPGVPGFCTTIESRYYNGDGAGRQSMQTEWQLRGIRADGTQFRPFEIDSPHDGTGIVAGFRCARIFAGTESVGASLSTAVKLDIKPKGAETAGGAVVTVTPGDTLVNGGRGLQVQFAAQTGVTQTGFLTSGNTNWGVTNQTNNTYPGGGQASYEVSTIGAGYAYFNAFSGSSGQAWSWGKNAADNFALCAHPVPSTNVVLTIDKTTRQAAFTNAPKLPSFTVATVPSAATYGAGSMIYVSNESGGAVVAFSDGTSWRRLTDRAVVS
ncbi:MAG: hypothetical protein JNL45_13070 [Hyphomicrobium sp.]|nr:hypothetical protein [Hyphomicrobium sp.]